MEFTFFRDPIDLRKSGKIKGYSGHISADMITIYEIELKHVTKTCFFVSHMMPNFETIVLIFTHRSEFQLEQSISWPKGDLGLPERCCTKIQHILQNTLQHRGCEKCVG